MEALLLFDEPSLTQPVLTAVIGVLVIFFVVSPVMGWILARGLARRTPW